MEMLFCLCCSNPINYEDDVCPYCDVENAYRPNQSDLNFASMIDNSVFKNKGFVFSDEEILALGLYPKDEGYKMSLISRILGKK